MSETLIVRLISAARLELARKLEDLCREIGAAESSVLLPAGDRELEFFASTNPGLLKPEVPRVPINASFSGIAYRTGQTLAIADAAGHAQHFEAVDAVTKERTHEFAAIPIAARETFGVLTLVNRAQPADRSRPFSLAELRRAESFSREAAEAFERLPGLRGGGTGEGGGQLAVGSELAAELSRLSAAERRVVRSLVDALIENRAR